MIRSRISSLPLVAVFLSCVHAKDAALAGAELACRHQQPRALALADEIERRDAAMPPGPPDPEADAAWCQNEIVHLGYIIVEKPWSNERDHFSTMLPGAFAVEHGFFDQPAAERAKTLCHEAVHARSQVRAGISEAARQYILAPEGRVAWEAVGYGMALRIKRRYGKRINTERYARGVAKTLAKYYATEPLMTRACVEGVLAAHWRKYD